MSNTFIQADAENVRSTIQYLLVSYPELAEDDELRADMFEGETSLHAIISRALEERSKAEEMVTGIKERATALSERKARYQRKSEAMKKLIKSLMTSADLPKVELPEATVSVTKPRQSVDVFSIDELPQGFYRTERKADSKTILAALEEGEEIPGAKLVTGDSGLTIRTK